MAEQWNIWKEYSLHPVFSGLQSKRKKNPKTKWFRLEIFSRENKNRIVMGDELLLLFLEMVLPNQNWGLEKFLASPLLLLYCSDSRDCNQAAKSYSTKGVSKAAPVFSFWAMLQQLDFFTNRNCLVYSFALNPGKNKICLQQLQPAI